MAEINLLKQKTASQDFLNALPKIVMNFLIFVLLGVIVFYAWLFIQTRSISSKISKTQEELSQVKIKANSQENRDELLTRQLQLSEFTKLLNSHIYWSKFFPELARVTLKTAAYSSFEASAKGTASLIVTVPNLTELDKFLQVFDNPKFNENFYNLRIGEFHKVQQRDNSTAIEFQVGMDFNPALIH
jgi:hypothetical protein